uniref:Jacalin-type lectin domain-containing protein n=1 Tax=Setaria viridis TaxID=4556 RepID=A0A4V6D3F6_SETVI|nr:hypothetical protein SEVIR_8G194800v2 [Setaria viridis]
MYAGGNGSSKPICRWVCSKWPGEPLGDPPLKKNSKGVLLRRQLLKVAPAEATKGKVLLSQSATSAKWGGNDGSREGGGFFILNPMKHIWLKLAKFGPWGGAGGKPRDVKIAPYRLDSVTISSGVVIDSIQFSYTDHDGQYHTIGPWGGFGGNTNSFHLGPSDFLIGVSGSIGSFNGLKKVITSLTFVTNARSYGPFGRARGRPFHIQVQSDGCIVGFFGHSRRYLEAIGFYTDQDARVTSNGPWRGDGGVHHDSTVKPHYLDHNGQQCTAGPSGGCGGSARKLELSKFGPWGGDGGESKDIKIPPYRLDSITISSGVIIDSIEFSYTDHDGLYHTTGPWGGHGGNNNTFKLGPSEFLTGVSGSIGSFNTLVNVITSLTFVTNVRSYGPFGKGRGPHSNGEQWLHRWFLWACRAISRCNWCLHKP